MEETGMDWGRLAERVRGRRRELGLTHAQVAAAGGPAVSTMVRIEAAARTGYRGGTLGRLERVLRWDGGSIEAILAGGEPSGIVLHYADPVLQYLSETPGMRKEDVEMLIQLARAIRR
jgi:hypothetical protein